MIPQIWIEDFQKIYKISDKVIEFIMETMKNSEVKLTEGEKTLIAMKIQIAIL